MGRNRWPGIIASTWLTIAMVGGWGCDSQSEAEALLAASSEAMAKLSFVSEDSGCPTCPPPTLFEYAPPDAVKLTASKGHDDWPFYLYVDRKTYFSTAGARWLTGKGEADRMAFILIQDPRAALATARSPRLGGVETIDGRAATIVVADFDLKRHLGRLPEELRLPDLGADVASLFAGTTVRFWIDREDERVIQMEFAGQGEATTVLQRFDYSRRPTIGKPTSTMDVEDVRALMEKAEPGLGRRLLSAIGEYRRLNGVYPPRLDQATISDVLPQNEWPTNVFSKAPIGDSAEPGDFTYRTDANGSEFEFTLHGWDGGQLYYDSARFGHPE